jgi:hypothetical protein
MSGTLHITEVGRIRPAAARLALQLELCLPRLLSSPVPGGSIDGLRAFSRNSGRRARPRSVLLLSVPCVRFRAARWFRIVLHDLVCRAGAGTEHVPTPARRSARRVRPSQEPRM